MRPLCFLFVVGALLTAGADSAWSQYGPSRYGSPQYAAPGNADDYIPYPQYAGEDYVPLPYPQYAEPPSGMYFPATEGPQGNYDAATMGGPAYSMPGWNEQPAAYGGPELIPAGVPAGGEAAVGSGAAPEEVLPGVVEIEPISEDSPEYQMFDPRYWFRTIDWDGSVELGLSGSAGNTDTSTISSGAKLKRKTELHSWGLAIKYTRSYDNSVQTRHNALGNLNYERLFQESPYTLFAKSGMEYDEFKAFNVRLTGNAGIGYRLIKRENAKLTFRTGAGFSREFGGPDDSWVPEGVFGTELEWKPTARQKISGEVEYFPDYSEFGEFRMVATAGWEFILDEAANHSLKLGATDRYDSTPNGRRPNDIDYSLLLIYNLP